MSMIELPSGRLFADRQLSVIRQMEKAGTVRWSDDPFTLKSGVKSHIYVFGREDLTDNPTLLRELGEMAADIVRSHPAYSQNNRRTGFIGIPTAGTALAVSAGLNPYCFSRIMREWRKEDYGAHKSWVNGMYSSDADFVTIDNVITNGATKIETLDRLKEDGYPVHEMRHLVLVDRQQGALEKLRAGGFKFESMFNLLDMTYAFGELGLWPRERVKAVEDEIAAHQFT